MKLLTLRYLLFFLLTIYSLNDSRLNGQYYNINKSPNSLVILNEIKILKTKIVTSNVSFKIKTIQFSEVDDIIDLKDKIPISKNKTAFYLGVGFYNSISLNNNVSGHISANISGNIIFKFSSNIHLNTGIDIYKHKYSRKALIALNIIPSLVFSENKTQISAGLGGTLIYGDVGTSIEPIASIKAEYYFRNNISFTTEFKNIINYSDYLNIIMTFGLSFIL